MRQLVTNQKTLSFFFLGNEYAFIQSETKLQGLIHSLPITDLKEQGNKSKVTGKPTKELVKAQLHKE